MANRLDIDLGALRSNYRALRRHRGTGELFAVVKQEAYGHGLEDCARALAAEGADGFAVAGTEEAQRLRAIGVEAPIMVMCALLDSDARQSCCALGLEPALGDMDTVREAAEAELPRLWLKVNTGMNRFGIHPDDVGEAIAMLRRRPRQHIGLMTHLASADRPDDDSPERQRALFASINSAHKLPTSIVNSAGYLRWGPPLADRARVGIALYGSSPLAGGPALLPVMTVRSQVLCTQPRLCGARVGYHGRDSIAHEAATAVIAIGYGDGYPFPGACGAPVLINGQRFPLIGRTSMNMIIADISEAKAPVARGDEVVLWGQGLPVDDIARLNGTIAYQLMCAATRLPRRCRGGA